MYSHGGGLVVKSCLGTPPLKQFWDRVVMKVFRTTPKQKHGLFLLLIIKSINPSKKHDTNYNFQIKKVNTEMERLIYHLAIFLLQLTQPDCVIFGITEQMIFQ